MGFAWIVFLMVALDQGSKYWAATWLREQPGQTLPIIQDVLHLTYHENTGAAFGIFEGKRWVFVALMSIAIIVMFGYLVKNRGKLGRWVQIALWFVISGAIGNLIDRIRLGYVVDFIDFRLINFAVFNVADSCVTIGVIMLMIALFFPNVFDKRKGGESAIHATKPEMKDAHATTQDSSSDR